MFKDAENELQRLMAEGGKKRGEVRSEINNENGTFYLHYGKVLKPRLLVRVLVVKILVPLELLLVVLLVSFQDYFLSDFTSRKCHVAG